MNAYEVKDLGFAYGGRQVLAEASLDIPQGAVTALVGPNGSGKTTLLHLLAFLATPTEGAIRFRGEPVDRDRAVELRRSVGVVLQNPYLFRGAVVSNVEWALRSRGLSKGDCLRRAVAALESVGLAGLRGRSAQGLSGGEAQRVALARALALDPEIILLDEPTNHVDETTRADVEALLLRRAQEQRSTVVLATHDLAQARRLQARVWRLDEGRVRCGEADNVLRGRPDPHEPDVFETGRLRIYVHPLPPGTTCIEISPREVILAGEAYPTSARNVLRGVVIAAEMINGEEVRVVLQCGEPVVAVVTRASWERLGATVGQTAVASFKATAVQTY